MSRALSWGVAGSILISAWACDGSKIPGLWRTYEHPTYRFTMKLPRTWEIKKETAMGTAVIFLADESDPLFRANVNIVAQQRAEKVTLEKFAELSLQQIAFVLPTYTALSTAPTKLGNLSAYEMRGKYDGTEGSRILRTILAFTEDLQYVISFSCRFEKEEQFTRTVNGMLNSFQAPPSLSPP